VTSETVGKRIDHITSELQEAIMRTRMQPIGNVFNKFPRVARDLARKLGKEMELTLEGKDVELDKTLIEAIGDPLTHLVRNAIDHGIEPPEEREKKGNTPSVVSA
jgi:two-component system chemotaxis sensor kinase CheA